MTAAAICSSTLSRTSRRQCAILTALLFLGGLGSRTKAGCIDVDGLVVCDVPPTEAVALTERHGESRPVRSQPKVRWQAAGPDQQGWTDSYKTERKALAMATRTVRAGVEPTYVCDITDQAGRTYRFWRLHRDLDTPSYPPSRAWKRTGKALLAVPRTYIWALPAVLENPLGLLTLPLAPLVLLERCACSGRGGTYDARSRIAAVRLPAADGEERYKLFNECRPIHLAVEDAGAGEKAIGLTRERLQAVGENRLRAFRLHTDRTEAADAAVLNVTSEVSALGFFVEIRYI